MDSILFSSTMLVALLGSILWYYVKFELRGAGKEVSWFVDHFRDFRLLREAIAEAQTEEKRRHFRRLQIAMYIFPVIFILGFVAISISFIAGG